MSISKKSTPQTCDCDWEAGSFARDSLVYAFGSLAASLLTAAFSDSAIGATYRKWLAKAADTPKLQNTGEILVTAGVDHGLATLIARSLPEEFCVRCEHSDFSALIAAGFQIERRQVSGIFVAEFNGSVTVATRFVPHLTHEITTRVINGSETIQPLNSVRHFN